MATFDEIMSEIKSNLTGDSDLDIKYLMETAESFKDSEFAQEVARECGRIVYSLLPDEKRDEIIEAIELDTNHNNDSLDKWLELKINNDNEAALEAIEPYALQLLEAQESGMCSEDKVSVYYDYDGLFEYILVHQHIKPKKEVRGAIVPFVKVYGAYASSLYDVGRYNESIKWYKRAIDWLPVSFYLYMEVAENYKRLNNLEETEKWTNLAFNYVTTTSEMARWLRGKAYIEIEREEYKLATAELLVSLGLEHDDLGVGELLYLKEECGFDIDSVDMQDAIKILEKNKVPYRATDLNLGILYEMLIIADENSDDEAASMFAQNLYDFTLDHELLEEYGKYIVIDSGEE